MSNSEHKNPQVLVCQRGARHRYAIPRLLEEAGMLEALYTNSSAYSVLGRMATGLDRLGFHSSSVHALAKRIPTGIPKEKIFSSDIEAGDLVSKAATQRSLTTVYKRWGLRGSSAIYSMYGENWEFLKWAKEQGSKIMIDVFVHPQTNRIVAAEEARIQGRQLPEWDVGEDRHSHRIFDLADQLLCPSEWVASGVRTFSPEQARKVRILPYGSSVSVAESINTPESGRILFAGREPLRKGLHYLAKAAWILRQDGLAIDVRVAGVSAADIGWMEHAEELNCLGSVPMEKMKDEYAKADVFALPSLSEGQAGVLLEAMACGCAVVATKESGVDFDEGCGITVPAGDAQVLAAEIKKILSDQQYRDALALGALNQASEFSMDVWKQRLVKMVEEVCNGS
jgi:glycosyltransferase involved in cell wall biosynthesis